MTAELILRWEELVAAARAGFAGALVVGTGFTIVVGYIRAVFGGDR